MTLENLILNEYEKYKSQCEEEGYDFNWDDILDTVCSLWDGAESEAEIDEKMCEMF